VVDELYDVQGQPQPRPGGDVREHDAGEGAAGDVHGEGHGQLEPLGIGLGMFLASTFPPAVALVEGILPADGSGFIGGEEKLGKSFYAVEEALCLALGLPVCGRFAVPVRQRVLFIEEEDPERRVQARVKALLRGKGLDPDDPTVQAELNTWFRIVVWEGFTFDDPEYLARLDRTLATFQPAVVYGDAFRKLTRRDLNKEAGLILAVLDDFRRSYGVMFRL